jgi:hypothetical protein
VPEHHHHFWNPTIQRLAAIVACALALTALSPPQASAQDAFSCIEELDDDQVRYRIRYIEDKLQDGKKHATRWRYTWMGLWLAAGGGMTYAAIAASRDRDDCAPNDTSCYDRGSANRFAWAYMAAGSYFVATTHMFMPAAGVWGAKRIRRKDESTEAARVAKLEYATNVLKKASNVQSFNAGAFGVVAGTIYGSVGGIIKATQWTGYTKGLTAAMFLGPPISMGLQTATAPTEAKKAYEAYRGIACSSKYYDTHEEGPEFDFSVSPGGGNFSIKF